MAATVPPARAPLLSLSATATELAVRDMIDTLGESLRATGVADDLRGSVTLAVGEALNNIVEHAYAGRAPGPVHLTADLSPGRIDVTLRDTGCALPGGALPDATLPDSSGARHTLPEGGFGWFLIQKLSHGLSYNRQSGQNTLCLSFSRRHTPQ